MVYNQFSLFKDIEQCTFNIDSPNRYIYKEGDIIQIINPKTSSHNKSINVTKALADSLNIKKSIFSRGKIVERSGLM
jgi:uncharacterized UPF0146 family protein